jgi:hypothetical protein
MKRVILYLLVYIGMFSTYSQEKPTEFTLKMIDENEQYRNSIQEVYTMIQVSEKFNNHNIT